MRRREHQSGFSTSVILLVVLVVAVLAVTGLVVYQHHKTNRAKNRAAATTPQTTTQPQNTTATQSQTNTYQGWNTYNDTGYAAASGISIKYPSDWKIIIPGVKAIGNATHPTAVINELDVFYPQSETPQAVWNDCFPTDACLGTSGEKIISGKATTINGLAAFTATMQSSYGTYHVTVIRGNKSTPPAGTPFVVFTTTTNDPAALNTYATIMASATFPN